MEEHNNILQNLITFMQQCPQINALYAIFGMAEDDAKWIVPIPDKYYIKEYADGSALKYVTFALPSFQSYNADLPIPPNISFGSFENIEDFMRTQNIIEWIVEQNNLGNYPSFGNNTKSEKMYPLTNISNISGQDTDRQIAKYMPQFRIEYIDYSNVLWGN